MSSVQGARKLKAAALFAFSRFFMSRFPIVFCASLGCLFASISGAHAQDEPAPATVQAAPTVAAPEVLSIALPPNARLRFDLDAQDDDVLGVVKSLMRGFNGSSLKEMLDSPAPAPAPNGAAPTSSGELAVLRVLSDADLGTMLENVHHLRVVAFETTNNYDNPKAQIALSKSVLDFYSQAYLTREGGRRVMRADFDDVQVLGVRFGSGGFRNNVFHTASFALVVQVPGGGMVFRGDGYPNFESVGPLIMAATLYGVAGRSAPITMP